MGGGRNFGGWRRTLARILFASGARAGSGNARHSSRSERGGFHFGGNDWRGDAPGSPSVCRGHAAADLDVAQRFVQRIFGFGRTFHAKYIQCAPASRRRRVADVPVVDIHTVKRRASREPALGEVEGSAGRRRPALHQQELRDGGTLRSSGNGESRRGARSRPAAAVFAGALWPQRTGFRRTVSERALESHVPGASGYAGSCVATPALWQQGAVGA